MAKYTEYKTNHLTLWYVYSSAVLSTFTQLCSHHPIHPQGSSHPAELNSVHGEHSLPVPSTPSAWWLVFYFFEFDGSRYFT